MITVGIDEVGRGCLAGPLVAGAVILAPDYVHDQTVAGWKLADSKKLTLRQRTAAAAGLQNIMLASGLGWVTAREIDRCGMSRSLRLAMRRALRAITIPYDDVVIDGNLNFLASNPKARAVIKADATVPAVSAASILAKVARDSYMCEIAAKRYARYGFDRHVGYGTSLHLQALAEYGATPLHRQSFAPLKNGLKPPLA